MTVVRNFKRFIACALGAAAISMAPFASAEAQSDLSEASALSLMPVAIVGTGSAMLLAHGVQLSVASVETSIDGTVLVLERVSDGAREVLQVSGEIAGGLSKGIGTSIQVIACSTGFILSAAGRAIAFVPNQIGNELLYNRRVTR